MEQNSNGFRPAWWMSGPHAQTLWGPVFRSPCLVTFDREFVTTPDDDFVVLDHVHGREDLPRVLLLHGLEGSSFSVYVQGIARRLSELGYPVTALNFRSCARETHATDRWIPNRQARLYYSGDTGDLDFVVRRIRASDPGRPLLALGVSVGGNVLLKWLGENPGQTHIARAAAISVPYDLAEGARHLESAIGRFYVQRFLQSLKVKIAEVVARFPHLSAKVDVEGANRARDFWLFDELATAPLHGFAGAADYYNRCSSIAYVDRITTPVLCISAADDPFLPPVVLERVRQRASPCVRLLVTARGGHVGFVGGTPWNVRYWAEEQAVHWLTEGRQ